jgi:hypothetical protein
MYPSPVVFFTQLGCDEKNPALEGEQTFQSRLCLGSAVSK